jgi:hypothetical protein
VEGAVTAAPEGNGQAPEAKPEPADSGEPPASDGAAESPPDEGAKAKPRGRGRPRSRAKAGNGAAAETEGSAASPAREPSEAGEPTS